MLALGVVSSKEEQTINNKRGCCQPPSTRSGTIFFSFLFFFSFTLSPINGIAVHYRKKPSEIGFSLGISQDEPSLDSSFSFDLSNSSQVPSLNNSFSLSYTRPERVLWLRPGFLIHSTTSTLLSTLMNILNNNNNGLFDPFYLHGHKLPQKDVFSSDPRPTNPPSSPSSTVGYKMGSGVASPSQLPPPRRAGSKRASMEEEGESLPVHMLRLCTSSSHPFWHRLSLASAKLSQSELFWLGLYFSFNLGLTLYNKIVLVTFPFPYTLTAIHAFCGSVGCYILHERDFYVSKIRRTSFPPLLAIQPPPLGPGTTDSSPKHHPLGLQCPLHHQHRRLQSLATTRDHPRTANHSQKRISRPILKPALQFHQVVRAASPLFTIVLAYFMTGATASTVKVLSLLPVVAGVGFTTYGDYYFTYWGLVLTLFGTLLASLKTVVTNLLQNGKPLRGSTANDRLTTSGTTAQSGIKLHPLDLLGRMSPLAFIQCVIYGWATGELEGVSKFGATYMDKKKFLALCINGIIAFGLNVVSFTANKKSGPLAISVAGEPQGLPCIRSTRFLC